MLEPFGICLFCDDVREEKDGKRTYVGVHGRVLNIASSRPAILPRLCIVSHIVVPGDYAFESFRHELVLAGKEGEVVIGQGVHEGPNAARLPGRAIKAVSGMEFAPLELSDDCELRASAIFNDLVIPLGALTVRFSDPKTKEPEPSEAAI